MELLIDKQTVSKYLNVAIGCSDKDFNRYIEEAQEFDLRPLICEDFFNSLLINHATPAWHELLEESKYEYQGKHYQHSGLKKVLAYFSYSRYILKHNITDSSHNFVIKKTPHAEPLSLEERRDFYYRYQADANTLFDNVKTFLGRKQSVYGNYSRSTKTGTASNQNFRVIQ